MVERHAQWFATPITQTTSLAGVLLEALGEKSLLQMGTVGLPAPHNQQLLDRHPRRLRPDGSSFNRRTPAARGNPKCREHARMDIPRSWAHWIFCQS
jgi:hypothetical protein